MGIEPLIHDAPVWRRCWCYQFGRCLVDCPTANIQRPTVFTDAEWRRAYEAVMASA